MDKAKLIEEIQQAFSSGQYPSDAAIVLDSPYAKIYPDYEGNTIAKVFKGKKWQEIDPDALARQNAAPGFLTQEAFHYYIPAYMMLMIQDIDKADILVEIIINKLTPLSENELGESFVKADLFTKEQGACIKHFLQYLQDANPDFFENKEPTIAIERYWKNF